MNEEQLEKIKKTMEEAEKKPLSKKKPITVDLSTIQLRKSRKRWIEGGLKIYR